MTLHSAKGLELTRCTWRPREGFAAPLAEPREPGWPRGGAPPRLCRQTRARERLQLSGPAAASSSATGAWRNEPFRRRDPRGAVTTASDSGCTTTGFAQRPAHTLVPSGLDVDALGHGGTAAPPAVSGFSAGQKGRHPLFGVGTVLRVEGGAEDLKLTVTFPGVGAKKLVARFAGLEMV